MFGKNGGKRKFRVLETRYEDASEDPTSLGNILLALGILNREQLEHAIQYQREHPKEFIGEVLVHLGYLNLEQINRACNYQCDLRQDGTEARNIAVLQYADGAAERMMHALNSLEDLITLTNRVFPEFVEKKE